LTHIWLGKYPGFLAELKICIRENYHDIAKENIAEKSQLGQKEFNKETGTPCYLIEDKKGNQFKDCSTLHTDCGRQGDL
jgi:hypothetical protein